MLKRITVCCLLALSVAPVALAAPAGADVTTKDDGRVLSDTLVIAPVSAPVNVCGNATSTTSPAKAHCHGDAEVEIAD
ncbi:chaplin family protein [Thermomonospora umbrina]|uniref:Small secreted domain DUF320 n=1 Tax=Thermomonospora umbrina TaxID=111806 RepID=A0A3D9SIY1_9ACTN|nr:chaplin family protein [Thermomonospora umbrina]REE95866.1 small secreted domain DUF320 [Thermomonospora umbrina]